MRGRGKGERGSALLMIMVAVTVVGILFGALYVSLSSSHRQAMEHERQVRAEFDAQKMMEIALYHFYQNIESQGDFEDKFSGTDGCLEDVQDTQDKVCLSIEKDNDGTYTKELLTATGVSEAKEASTVQTRVIQLDLLAIGGGGAPGDDTERPKPLPKGEVPEDSKPSLGQSCFYSNERLPLRALAVGTDLDLTNATQSKTVQIEGGLYIPEGQRVTLPDVLDHKFTNINGLIYDEDNLQYEQSLENDGSIKPEASALGATAMRDTLCYNFPSFHDKVSEIADRAIRQNQSVPVYTFESTDGIVTLDAKGKRKEAMYQQFFEYPGVTLREVLQGDDEKIIVVKGKLMLDQSLNSRGYLVVYDDRQQSMSSIEMPSGFVWHHDGGILTDTIGWPTDYKLTIKLSKGQVKLYDQSIDW